MVSENGSAPVFRYPCFNDAEGIGNWHRIFSQHLLGFICNALPFLSANAWKTILFTALCGSQTRLKSGITRRRGQESLLAGLLDQRHEPRLALALSGGAPRPRGPGRKRPALRGTHDPLRTRRT